jgi:hypothetical protein
VPRLGLLIEWSASVSVLFAVNLRAMKCREALHAVRPAFAKSILTIVQKKELPTVLRRSVSAIQR